jgi:hypothetical protein
VFADDAQRGKSSRGWCYGCKLHFVIHDEGDLLAPSLTPGHVADRTPVPGLAEGLGGSCSATVATSVRNSSHRGRKPECRSLPSANATGKVSCCRSGTNGCCASQH